MGTPSREPAGHERDLSVRGDTALVTRWLRERGGRLISGQRPDEQTEVQGARLNVNFRSTGTLFKAHVHPAFLDRFVLEE